MVLLVFLLSGKLEAQEKSVQLNLGTQGVGAEFNYPLSPVVALRGGLNLVPLKGNNVFEISDFNSESKVSADFYNVHLLTEYMPFKQLSWFHLTGGLAYFLREKAI
jgi:hypothetical protein